MFKQYENSTRITMAALLALLTLPGCPPAPAAAELAAGLYAGFASADAAAPPGISYIEAAAFDARMTQAIFEAIDTNGDALLNLAELHSTSGLAPIAPFDILYGEDGAVAYSVVETPDGGLAFTGTHYVEDAAQGMWVVKTDAAGGILWSRTLHADLEASGQRLINTSDGGFAVVGAVRTETNGNVHVAHLVKLDRNGEIEWEATYPSDTKQSGALDEGAFSIAQFSDRGYALSISALTQPAGADRLLRVDTDGNVIWSRRPPGPPSGGLAGLPGAGLVNLLQDGTIVHTGEFTWEEANTQSFLFGISEDGEELWRKAFGDSGANTDSYFLHAGTGLTESGDVLAGGYLSNPSGGVTPAGLARVSPNGSLRWFRTYASGDFAHVTSVAGAADGGIVATGGQTIFREKHNASRKSRVPTAGAVERTDALLRRSLFLLMTDGDGNELGRRVWDANDSTIGWQVTTTHDGGYVISGQTKAEKNGPWRAFLIRGK